MSLFSWENGNPNSQCIVLFTPVMGSTQILVNTVTVSWEQLSEDCSVKLYQCTFLSFLMRNKIQQDFKNSFHLIKEGLCLWIFPYLVPRLAPTWFRMLTDPLHRKRSIPPDPPPVLLIDAVSYLTLTATSAAKIQGLRKGVGKESHISLLHYNLTRKISPNVLLGTGKWSTMMACWMLLQNPWWNQLIW